MDQVTENPGVGDTEVWEIYNTTADAHPMHIHELAFEVLNRQRLVRHEEEVVQPIQLDRNITPPKSWETGVKDTVVALPGQVTRVRAQFLTPGQFVWHCHIVEHEDNEMMRPYRIGPLQDGQPPDPEHSWTAEASSDKRFLMEPDERPPIDAITEDVGLRQDGLVLLVRNIDQFRLPTTLALPGSVGHGVWDM
jgi:hypothetical protein